MNDDNKKFVDFEKYCATCKHDKGLLTNPNIGTYDGEKWSGAHTREEYVPCCFCLEEGAREGTEVPVEWEEKI